MSDLLPCPFCGGEAHHIEAVNGSNLIYTGCKSCRVRYEATYGEHDYFDTITAWNTRAPQWQKYQDWYEDFGDCLFASTEDNGKIIDEAYFGSPLCSSWPWEYGPNDHLIWMSLPQPPEEKP